MRSVTGEKRAAALVHASLATLETTMIRFSSRALLAGGALMLFVSFDGSVAAQPGYVPSFQTGPNGWQHRFGGSFPHVPGSASPTMQDPRHLHFNNEMARINNTQPNYRIGDVSNANLKQWAKDAMKKDNDEVLAGKIAYTPGQSCHPQGVPAFTLAQGPIDILQTAKKVTIIEESSQMVRHVYLNEPHPANVKPSWLGHSVGRYEGDTLVIDTIGLNTKAFVDSFRTPHSEKLHVVERWRVIEGGHTLDVRIRVEDPDTFEQPWETYVQYRRAQEPFDEVICQEGNFMLFGDDYNIPKADKPDF
jgi:hypothetical protein